jgi:hypothetical protein
MGRRRLHQGYLQHGLAVDGGRTDVHVLIGPPLEQRHKTAGVIGVVGKEIDDRVKMETVGLYLP